jgi:glutamyl-tRNA synthetase
MYDTFGWERPVYVHLPPVMKDATHKLSKRNGDASFQDLVAKGYLPEAIINYIALLGWNPGTEEEIFSIKELEKIFSVERLNKSPSIFDIVKLTWMNGVYIRNLSEEDFYKYAEPYFAELSAGVDKKALARALQPRIETLAQIPEQIAFVKEVPEYSPSLYENKKMKTDVEVAKKALPLIKDVLANQIEWNNDALFAALKALAEANEMKNGQILYPARIAFSGLETTPGGATELAVVLGKEECLRRIDSAIKKLV